MKNSGAIAMNAGLTMHVDLLRARNAHHAAEAIFKAAAVAWRMAVRRVRRRGSDSVHQGSSGMIAVIDFGAGNLRSIQRALQETGSEVIVTDDPDVVVSADRVVLPGDGNAKAAMEYLHQKQLAEAALTVAAAGKPFLGVCVGMQLLFGAQEEGPTHGLGLLDGEVRLSRKVSRSRRSAGTSSISDRARHFQTMNVRISTSFTPMRPSPPMTATSRAKRTTVCGFQCRDS